MKNVPLKVIPKNSQIALITGASSGIGKAFATHFAGMGYALIITGRQMDKLHALALKLKAGFGVDVKVIKADFSIDEDLNRLLNEIETHDKIFVLVNNAGFGSGLEFCENSLTGHLRMIQAHIVASTELAYAVLPQMIKRKNGIIINVSSIGAYIPAPGNSIYSASKIFLKNLTESIHLEVHQHGVKLQCLCPGLTNTEFHNRINGKKFGMKNDFLWMNPEEVVQDSLLALQKDKIICVPGLVNKMIVGISVLIPRQMYYWIIEKFDKPARAEKITLMS
jgi:short-subunit dehydrogenase